MVKRPKVHGAFDIKSFVWTAWTRSGLVFSEWLQSYGKRKQRRCWIRTPHWLPLKAVSWLVSSLGAQARFTSLSCKAYFSSSLHMRSTALEHLTHPPFALLPPAAPSFFLCLLMLIMKHTLTFLLCRVPHQDSPGSLCSQQFILFPCWNIFRVFPHSFQSNISDVRSLLIFFQLVYQSFVQIWLTADTHWPLLETVTEKPDFSVHGWQTITAVFPSGLFHLELC